MTHLAILRAHTFVILLGILVSLCWLWKGRVLWPAAALQDSWESSCGDSCSFMMSCAHAKHVSLVFLFFSLLVYWMPCIVQFTPHHTSKISILKNWLYHSSSKIVQVGCGMKQNFGKKVIHLQIWYILVSIV